MNKYLLKLASLNLEIAIRKNFLKDTEHPLFDSPSYKEYLEKTIEDDEREVKELEEFVQLMIEKESTDKIIFYL